MTEIIIDESLFYLDGTQRVHDGETTLKNAKSQLKTIGVTRIADITDLDRIGIPVFSSIRPSAAKGGISIYSGKGATADQARISAMMEGFERCLAERAGTNDNIDTDISAQTIIKTHEEAVADHNILDPALLLLPEPLLPDKLVDWTEGWDLLKNEAIFVPSNAVYHPYIEPGQCVKLFRSNTNGLAAGNVMEEAIFHGLLEVIERDALSSAEFNRNTGKELILTPDDGINYELVQKFNDTGVEIRLWVLNHDTNVTTVVAATDDVKSKDAAMLVMGAGSHLKPEIAVSRAITEAAQSRLVQIHGAREDTDREKFVRNIGYDQMKRMNKFWYENKETISLAEIKDVSTPTPAENIRVVLDQLKNIVDNVIVVNLSREGINIPVVRVIIPTFELYTLDRERVGSRMRLVKRQSMAKEDRPWRNRRGPR
ncbi:MAG: YcaO-related McrA-glycine thioamidation protein [Methanosarcinaceae archaeon]|nr:YcaO-related McrA-glycine thioamidation protein [Methanosarcinaceae archaeon]